MKLDKLRSQLKNKAKDFSVIFPNQDEVWKSVHFVKLEQVINEHLKHSDLMTMERKYDLGTTISSSTLKRIIEKDYSEKSFSDLRFIKSLDKISIFLGYEDFNNLMLDECDKHHSNGNIVYDEGYFYKFINEYFDAEFKSYDDFSKAVSVLSEFVFEDGPYMARVKGAIKLLEEKGVYLNKEDNRSNYELINLKIVSVVEDRCILDTEEFWNLVYISDDNNDKFIFHRKNSQTYFLRKSPEGQWKIWDNYNPDSGKYVKESSINEII